MPPSKRQSGEDEQLNSKVNENSSNRGQTIPDRNLEVSGGKEINSRYFHWCKPEERLSERRIRTKRTERGQQWKREAETELKVTAKVYVEKNGKTNARIWSQVSRFFRKKTGIDTFGTAAV